MVGIEVVGGHTGRFRSGPPKPQAPVDPLSPCAHAAAWLDAASAYGAVPRPPRDECFQWCGCGLRHFAAGIRHGCPVSRALSALAVDPLVRACAAKLVLRWSRLYLFDDDLAIVLCRLVRQLPELHGLLPRWRSATGMRLQERKCVFPPPHHNFEAIRTDLDRLGLFRDAKIAMSAQYLGVQVGVSAPAEQWAEVSARTFAPRRMAWVLAFGCTTAIWRAYSSTEVALPRSTAKSTDACDTQSSGMDERGLDGASPDRDAARHKVGLWMSNFVTIRPATSLLRCVSQSPRSRPTAWLRSAARALEAHAALECRKSQGLAWSMA